jgi:hypothetical protein
MRKRNKKVSDEFAMLYITAEVKAHDLAKEMQAGLPTDLPEAVPGSDEDRYLRVGIALGISSITEVLGEAGWLKDPPEGPVIQNHG